MIKKDSHFDPGSFAEKLFDEARSTTGTWSSITISDLTNHQGLFSENNVQNIIERGINMIMDDKEQPSTKFKLAQLFSQLYNMNFPFFADKFKNYIETIREYIEIPQSSYLWKPTVNLLSSIIFQMQQK